MLKYQQFKDSKNDEIESSISKRRQLNMHDNEKRQSLNMYEGEGKGEGKRDILFFFIGLLFFSQKELNCPINLGKRTKSLNHLVYILKICYLEKC